VLESSTLPGKLADCSTRDPASLRFISWRAIQLEAQLSRDVIVMFQAILPLRGKILNIEKTDDAKIYKNSEIQALITALGLGIKGEEFQSFEKNLRYHRIVIMTDADVDGAHIRTLLLTFFYRYQTGLGGRAATFILHAPLSTRWSGARSITYCYNEQDLKTVD
jgi:DNA gyrase subunit B